MIYEGGRDPFLMLVAVYIFMPYFTRAVVGDPVAGQSIVATYTSAAGVVVAILAPLLGAIVDQFGRIKLWLIGVTLLLIPLIASLWWAMPEGRGLGIPSIVAILFTVNILYACSEMLHNALLPSAAPSHQRGRVSGLALFVANILGATALITLLVAFVLPGRVDLPFVPPTPLFGVDAMLGEPERLAPVLSAMLLALGLIPLALMMPDTARSGQSIGRSIALGVSSLRRTISEARKHRDAFLFLLVRMLFADGITATAIFIGIFASGVMGWGITEMLAFALIQCVFSGSGGLVAGWLDSTVGPRRAVQIFLVGVIFGLTGLVGTSPRAILFFWEFAPAANVGFLSTPPEIAFILFAGAISLCGGATYCSSRTLLTTLVPEDRIGAFFGLYALSGKATVWLGPLLVGLFTSWFGTQQAGIVPVIALLLLGLAGLTLLRGGTGSVKRDPDPAPAARAHT
ncbi:hypothetical protein sos41_40380 [Alphaproteobacteria bacterium SO-S41]|nr:hypothetical protein sos41_40380 [Alphaproteobacteria bacterium SO-S41]